MFIFDLVEINLCIFELFSQQETVFPEQNCEFKVDEYGFFIYWKSAGKVRLKFMFISFTRLKKLIF